MSFTVVIIAIAAAMFILSYLTRRRFGILGLGLLSGSYLASAWAGTTVPYVEKTGINFHSLGLPALAVMTVVITLLPALILLVNSPKQHGKSNRIISALAFGLLGGVLLTATLASVLPLDSFGKTIDTFVVSNYSLLVTAGIVLSIVDLFLARSAPRPRKSRSA